MVRLACGPRSPGLTPRAISRPELTIESAIEKADRIRYIAAWTYCLIRLPCSMRGPVVPLIDVRVAVALKVLLEFLYSRILFKETKCTSCSSPWSLYRSSAC